MKAADKRRAIIASGGTGGHFYPGLALANELRAAGWRPLFLVKKGDISIPALREHDHPCAELDMTSLPRAADPLALAAFVRRLAGSTLACSRIITDFRPAFVVGTGSYISFPAVLAAALRGLPSMIHESNAVFGLANRLSGVFATKVALGLPVKNNPFAAKSELTGTPVRDFFSGLPPSGEAKAGFSLRPDRPAALAFGGSQGARRLNQAVFEAAQRLAAGNPDFQLLHITGRRDFAEFSDKYAAAGLAGRPGVKLLDYCGDMARAYAAADLVISRSGGSTVSELSAVKKPSLLAPLPGSPGDHQTENARLLSEKGAAVLLDEKDPAFTAKLTDLTRDLLAAPEKLAAMRGNLDALRLPDALAAARALRAVIEKHTGG